MANAAYIDYLPDELFQQASQDSISSALTSPGQFIFASMEDRPACIEENVALAPHISFKVGGPARFYAAPASKEQLAESLAWARAKNLPLFLLGRGTNLVFSDRGFPGLVLHLGRQLNRIEWHGERVVAQSGALLHSVVTQSVQRGMAGIQHLAGIPGTMGGGTYINAGAFNQELKDTVTRVISCTLEGELRERSASECGFGYRHSRFFEWNEVILETELSLNREDPEALRAEMLETLRRRKGKQPLELPNAGSMFKRPPGTYAGLLIENAGLKGHAVGGARISEKHANFVVNFRNSSAQDIWDVSSDVILKVRDHCGITLEREVIFVGEFLPWPRSGAQAEG